jgi:hypothetical protein
MSQNSRSWTNLIFYGEVVGFAAAWVVGVVALIHTQSPEPRLAGTDGLAHAEVGLSDLSPEKLK